MGRVERFPSYVRMFRSGSGYSYYLTVPRKIARKLGLKKGDVVIVTIEVVGNDEASGSEDSG